MQDCKAVKLQCHPLIYQTGGPGKHNCAKAIILLPKPKCFDLTFWVKIPFGIAKVPLPIMIAKAQYLSTILHLNYTMSNEPSVWFNTLLKEMKKVNSASNWIKVCSDGSYKVQLLFYL